jgi:hypothetical protein
MPFSKHEVNLEHIETTRVAFRKVCEAHQLDCKPGEPLTDLIVMKIVEYAKPGESNPDRLCRKVLLELAEHPPGSAGK